MKTSTWKAVEREIAAILAKQWDDESIQRIPVTGRVSGDIPDIHHPYFAIEVKHRKSLPKPIKEIPSSLAYYASGFIGSLKNLGSLQQLQRVYDGESYADDALLGRLRATPLVQQALEQALRAAKTQKKGNILLIFHQKGMKYEDSKVIHWVLDNDIDPAHKRR